MEERRAGALGGGEPFACAMEDRAWSQPLPSTARTTSRD